MTGGDLSFADIAICAGLVALSVVACYLASLRIHNALLIAAIRLVLQLMLVGTVLRYVFHHESELLTVAVLLVMASAAAYEVGSRQKRRMRGWWRYGLGGAAVAISTVVIGSIGLASSLRPEHWFAARSVIPLFGLLLGNTMNSVSLALDTLLQNVFRERAAIEARLTLGAPRMLAMSIPIRQAVRTALIPTINSMAAAGVITMPGIMTGQLLAGMDPMRAAKYQIVLMFLITSANVIGSVGAVTFAARRLTDERDRLRLDRVRSVD